MSYNYGMKCLEIVIDNEPAKRKLLPLVRHFLLGVIVIGLISPALGQLAVTEIHSNQSTNGIVISHSDWWELTNYGQQPVDLKGYRFNDSNGGLTNGVVELPSLILAPGESVIFVDTITPEVFRAWWGAELKSTLQIHSYSTNSIGLSSTGDGLRLWAPGTTNANDYVDFVDFGASGVETASFVYNLQGGGMDSRAVLGVEGGFLAADNGDLGSPGMAPKPDAAAILDQPLDLLVNPGDAINLSVKAKGLPRPRYQWFFGANPIAGAVSPRLQILPVSSDNLGEYSVEVWNDFGRVTNRSAVVSLQRQPQAPTISTPLTNAVISVGGSTVFKVMATGFPPPEFAWLHNGIVLPGEIGSELTLTNVLASSSGKYTVIVKNNVGMASSEAELKVRTKPSVKITEVRSTDTLDPDFSRRMGFVAQDWFELTSFESGPLDLKGWRIDDNSASLTAAFTVTSSVVVLSGESVIFVERLTPEQFRLWWGTNNLPANLQIITYSGSGFGLSSGGDGVRVWDDQATSNEDTLASVDFPSGTAGATFGYDPETGLFGGLSTEGKNGVYQAPGSVDGELNLVVKDVGSPGRIAALGEIVSTAPKIQMQLAGSAKGLEIKFNSVIGKTYRLQRTLSLSPSEWTTVWEERVDSTEGRVEVQISTGEQSFFRIFVP